MYTCTNTPLDLSSLINVINNWYREYWMTLHHMIKYNYVLTKQIHRTSVSFTKQLKYWFTKSNSGPTIPKSSKSISLFVMWATCKIKADSFIKNIQFIYKKLSSSFTENILLINWKHPKIFSRILLLPQIFKLILFRQRDKWKSSNLIYFYRQLSIKFSLFFLSCLR